MLWFMKRFCFVSDCSAPLCVEHSNKSPVETEADSGTLFWRRRLRPWSYLRKGGRRSEPGPGGTALLAHGLPAALRAVISQRGGAVRAGPGRAVRRSPLPG